MYVPHFNAMDDPAEIRAFVTAVGSAELVTVGADGTPIATLLPVLWSEDGGTVVVHMARANQHWRADPAGVPGTGGGGRPAGLRLAGLVRLQGRARPRRAHLELLGGAPRRHRHGATTTPSGCAAR